MLSRVHKSFPFLRIPVQTTPVHTLESYLFKIWPNIILPFMPSFSKWSLSFRFITRHWMYFSFPSHACRILRPSYLPWIYRSTVRPGGQLWICSWRAIILSNFLSLYPSHAHKCPLSILFWNTLTLCPCCGRGLSEGNVTVIQHNGQRHGCVC